MKRLFLFFICLIIINCSLYLDESKIPKFNSVSEVNIWVHSNIIYVTDIKNYNYYDYWASPQEVIDKMSGDCEDHAILMMKICADQFGFLGDLIIISNDGRDHALVKINNKYYDPTAGNNELTVDFSSVKDTLVLDYNFTMMIAGVKRN